VVSEDASRASLFVEAEETGMVNCGLDQIAASFAPTSFEAAASCGPGAGHRTRIH